MSVPLLLFIVSQVLSEMASAGIAVRIATKKLAAEEAPESYKDVSQVRTDCTACTFTDLLEVCHGVRVWDLVRGDKLLCCSA